jgi:hypothetical protein
VQFLIEGAKQKTVEIPAGKPPSGTVTVDHTFNVKGYRSNDKAVLMYLEGAKLRVAGTIELL